MSGGMAHKNYETWLKKIQKICLSFMFPFVGSMWIVGQPPVNVLRVVLTKQQCVVLRYGVSLCVTVWRCALRCVVLNYGVSLCVTVCCAALRCVMLRYGVSLCITVCCSALRCVLLHYRVSLCVTECCSALPGT